MVDAEMPAPSGADITNLLQAWRTGDQSALEQLIPLVYAELHRLAQHYMANEQPDGTLQTTNSTFAWSVFGESPGRTAGISSPFAAN